MGCRLNQSQASFQKAADNLSRTAHIDIGKDSLRLLVEAEGEQIQRQMQQAKLTPDWSSEDCFSEAPGQSPTRFYLGCDGVLVPLITAQEKKCRQGVRKKRQRIGRRGCGAMMTPKSCGPKSKRYFYYSCTRQDHHGHKLDCEAPLIPTEALKEAVIERVVRIGVNVGDR